MKTTQKQAVSAYKALLEVCKLSFPIRDALALLRLKKALEMAYDFQVQEEQKLIDEYQPTIDGDKITLPFDTEEAKARAKEFFAKFAELNNMEVEVETEPVLIAIPEWITISPETLLALDGFVEWGE